MALKVETEELHDIINEELVNILKEDIDWEADDDVDIKNDFNPNVPVKAVPKKPIDNDKSVNMALSMAKRAGLADHAGLQDFIRSGEIDNVDEGDMATKHFSGGASKDFEAFKSDSTRAHAIKIYDSAIRKWNRERADQIRSQEVKPLLTFSMNLGNKDLAKQYKDWSTDPNTGEKLSSEELNKKWWNRPAQAKWRAQMKEKFKVDPIDMEPSETERDTGAFYDFSGQKEKMMQAAISPFKEKELKDSGEWEKVMSDRQFEAYGDSWMYPISPQDIDKDTANTLENLASDWLPSATTDDFSDPLTYLKYIPGGLVATAPVALAKVGSKAIKAIRGVSKVTKAAKGPMSPKQVTRMARQQARDGRKIFKSAKADAKVTAKEAKEARKALQKLENRANNPLRRTPKAEELANARAAAKKAEDAASGAADRLKRAEAFKDNSQQYYKNVKSNPGKATDVANKADEIIKSKSKTVTKAEPPGGFTPGRTKIDTGPAPKNVKPYYLDKGLGAPGPSPRMRIITNRRELARKEYQKAVKKYGKDSSQAQKALDKQRKINQNFTKSAADDALKPGTNSNKALEAQKKALLDDMNAAAAARTTGNKVALEAAEKSAIGKLGSAWNTTKNVGLATAGGLTAAHLGTSYYLKEKYGIPFTMGISMVNKWLHDEAGMTFLEDFIGEVPDDMKKKLEAVNRDLKKINISKEKARELARQQRVQNTPVRVDESYIFQKVMENLLTAIN